MKLALLSGAYKNAGDFLIEKRSKALLQYVYPEAEVEVFERRYDLRPYLEQINQKDVIILAGGPVYQPSIYPNSIPLISQLEDITTPIFALGLGWKGKNRNPNYLYRQYNFTKETLKLWKKIESDGMSLGCRDWYSVRILKEHGIRDTKMTGCPAWYDLEKVEKTELRNSKVKNGRIKKVCISDPANVKNFSYVLEVISFIRKCFSDCEIKFVFHRGVNTDKNTPHKMGNQLEKWQNLIGGIDQVECVDISYGEKGFGIYDDCDLHIGFRVHAHIYNLSQRNISILINEDARGHGVNDALGLENIDINIHRDLLEKCKQDIYISKMLDDYLESILSQNCIQFEVAFQNMKHYYRNMLEHLQRLREKDDK